MDLIKETCSIAYKNNYLQQYNNHLNHLNGQFVLTMRKGNSCFLVHGIIISHRTSSRTRALLAAISNKCCLRERGRRSAGKRNREPPAVSAPYTQVNLRTKQSKTIYRQAADRLIIGRDKTTLSIQWKSAALLMLSGSCCCSNDAAMID